MYGKIRGLSMFLNTPLQTKPFFLAVCTGFLLLLYCMNMFVDRQWDFSVYYMAGYALNHGLNPYNRDQLIAESQHLPSVEYGGLPYLYPPLVTHLFQPLAFIPYFEAKFVWLMLKCLALEALIILTIRLCSLPCSPITLLSLHIAAIWFRPIRLDFNAGNMAIFEALFLYSFFWYWKNQRLKSAACMISLAGSIKITPLLMILYPLHLRKYNILIPIVLCLSIFGIITVIQYDLLLTYFAFYQSELWLRIWDEQVQSFFNCSSTTVILRTFTDTYFAQPIIESNIASLILIPLFPISIFMMTAYTINHAIHKNQVETLHVTIISLLITTLLLLPPRLAGYTLTWLFLPYVCAIKESVTHKKYGIVVILLVSIGLLQAVIPPEHIDAGLTQLLIDKEFFALVSIFIAITLLLPRKF